MREKSERQSETELFDFPVPPQEIPAWACTEAKKWQGLRDFDIEVQAETHCPFQVEIRYADLPKSVWGLHVARGKRVRLCVNKHLPPHWRRFALFHELYHLLSHSKGEHFWSQTFQPLTKFECEADLFAWAAVLPEWPEWSDGGEEE